MNAARRHAWIVERRIDQEWYPCSWVFRTRKEALISLQSKGIPKEYRVVRYEATK